MTAEPDIVDRLRQSLGSMDDACDGCIPEECGDKMVATIANEAAGEIEALRSIVRRQADRLEDCRRFVGSDRVSVIFHDHEFVAFLAALESPEEASEPNHDYRAARGVVDLGGIPAEQAIRRLRDGDQP